MYMTLFCYGFVYSCSCYVCKLNLCIENISNLSLSPLPPSLSPPLSPSLSLSPSLPLSLSLFPSPSLSPLPPSPLPPPPPQAYFFEDNDSDDQSVSDISPLIRRPTTQSSPSPRTHIVTGYLSAVEALLLVSHSSLIVADSESR